MLFKWLTAIALVALLQLMAGAAANASGGQHIASAPQLPLYADVAGSTYPQGSITDNPPDEYWKVQLSENDQLKVDFSRWVDGSGGVELCLLTPGITDFTVNDAPCTAYALTGANGYGELKYTVPTTGNWILQVSALWCCGDGWGYEINEATVKHAATPGPTGGYPWANAVCLYGDYVGGPKCHDPSGRNGDFNWGYPKRSGTARYANPATGGFAYRNCTDYTAWRLHLKAGHPFNGDASHWRGEAKRGSGWIVHTKPHVGDIAWWGTYNHVAVVSKANIKTGVVTVSEYNWPVVIGSKKFYGVFGTRQLKPGDRNYPQKFLHRT